MGGRQAHQTGDVGLVGHLDDEARRCVLQGVGIDVCADDARV